VPVVLTGTSYSLRANFAGFLQQALTAKVLNAAKDGGGFLLATTQYLKDDAFRSAKPKLLLWELPERFLYSPLVEEPQWLKNVGLDP
jgi:alginate O-acetyltransferase complex protein AlgJ